MGDQMEEQLSEVMRKFDLFEKKSKDLNFDSTDIAKVVDKDGPLKKENGNIVLLHAEGHRINEDGHSSEMCVHKCSASLATKEHSGIQLVRPLSTQIMEVTCKKEGKKKMTMQYKGRTRKPLQAIDMNIDKMEIGVIPVNIKWSPPPGGKVIINTNAVTDGKKKRVGLGECC
ncbi:hypothetical protein ACH5RR_018721 [Cinchona calisaya]|uniref:Uncharacterized protein n=1 Tax=Cinchona calisaya TaxID=153742 RepID=A0ABD2ZM97_9GENT